MSLVLTPVLTQVSSDYQPRTCTAKRSQTRYAKKMYKPKSKKHIRDTKASLLQQPLLFSSPSSTLRSDPGVYIPAAPPAGSNSFPAPCMKKPPPPWGDTQAKRLQTSVTAVYEPSHQVAPVHRFREAVNKRSGTTEGVCVQPRFRYRKMCMCVREKACFYNYLPSYSRRGILHFCIQATQQLHRCVCVCVCFHKRHTHGALTSLYHPS